MTIITVVIVTKIIFLMMMMVGGGGDNVLDLVRLRNLNVPEEGHWERTKQTSTT